MKDQDSKRFSQWWLDEGSKIQGKFALAVAAWDEAQKGLGIPLVKIESTEPIIGTKETLEVRVVNADEYVAIPENTRGSCSGCVALDKIELCSELGSKCFKDNIVWVKLDNSEVETEKSNPIVTIEGKSYIDTSERDKLSCKGCVADGNRPLCKILDKNKNCLDHNIIWVEVQKEENKNEVQ